MKALSAEEARSVRPHERCDNEITLLHRAHVVANVLNDADESCPIRRPVSVGSIDLYGHRSLPQMAERVTRTSASVGSIRRASGTVSTRTSPAPYMRVARIAQPPTSGAAEYSSSVT